jgi:hypothetical protein
LLDPGGWRGAAVKTQNALGLDRSSQRLNLQLRMRRLARILRQVLQLIERDQEDAGLNGVNFPILRLLVSWKASLAFPARPIARRGRVRDPIPCARVQAGAVEGFRAKRPSTAADARANPWIAHAAPALAHRNAMSVCVAPRSHCQLHILIE